MIIDDVKLKEILEAKNDGCVSDSFWCIVRDNMRDGRYADNEDLVVDSRNCDDWYVAIELMHFGFREFFLVGKYVSAGFLQGLLTNGCSASIVDINKLRVKWNGDIVDCRKLYGW